MSTAAAAVHKVTVSFTFSIFIGLAPFGLGYRENNKGEQYRVGLRKDGRLIFQTKIMVLRE